MKLIGFRSRMGKGLIGDAIGTFEAVNKKLEDGINHCQADANQHQMAISEHQGKIRDLGIHIARGQAVLAKLKDLIAIPDSEPEPIDHNA